MPPTLRSAQNSPARKAHKSELPTPTATPTRKTPQCSHCKRPRVGHPRSGCPYVDSPVNNKPDENLISGALRSLNISTQGGTVNEEQKPHIRDPQHRPTPLGRTSTQLSLTTTSNEILGHLSQSGIFADVTEGDMSEMKGKVPKIVRWQDAVTSTPKPNRPLKPRAPSRSPMPGTLIPPSPFSSFGSLGSDSGAQAAINNSPSEPTPKDIDNPPPISPPVPRSQARPLARSMSAVERDIFIAKLTVDASATVYIVPKADLESIMAQAQSLNFFTAHIMNEVDPTDDQALLILGRTEDAVQALLKKIEVEHDKLSEKQQRKGSGSNFKVVAGSALVGAVGAWAGLAFS